MFHQLFSIGAVIAVTFYATVLTQYHHFTGRPVTLPEPVVVENILPSVNPQENPFEITLDALIRSATSTPRVESPTPAPTRTPIVPFTPLPVPTVPEPIIPSVPEAPAEPVVEQVEERLSAEALLKAAIVNVICLPGGGLRGTSGTGVIIDPRGVVVTVAHIGQNFLLTDYPTQNAGKCYIRTGSPAKNAYTAELIYVSREWLSDNPATFLESRPKGTGENDYAFLVITGSLTDAPLPRSFTYIPFAPAGTDVAIDDRVGVGSYGAEFLTSSEVRSSLYPTISFAPVNDVFTFENSTEDVISVHAGAAAQEGSSGGAVINEDNQLIGVISTRTVRSDLSLRDLQAISVDHIRRSFREDMREGLDSYLANNTLTGLVARFESLGVELLEGLAGEIECAEERTSC